MQNMFYVDIGTQVKLAYISSNIFAYKYTVNMETFDFVSNERPNIGFSFVLA